MIGIPLFIFTYSLLIFYYVPLLINSTPDIPFLENLTLFVRYQEIIDYKKYFLTIYSCVFASLVFLLLGYLIPFKLPNLFFANKNNNLSKVLLITAVFLFTLQLFGIISYGPSYFTGYFSIANSQSFPSALQLSIIASEYIGIINAINISIRNPNKYILPIFISSLVLLIFRAKRLELLSLIVPTFLSLQKKNLASFKSKYKFILLFFLAFIFLAALGTLRIGGNINILSMAYNLLLEPFLGSQTFQGFLTINDGMPRFLFVNTLAGLFSIIPTIIFPNKWDYLNSLGYYENKDLNANGANVVLTGLYDDYGILGIIIFSLFLGAIIRYADKSRILDNTISYKSSLISLNTILYYLMPVIILHFRDGFANTIKYFIQGFAFICFVILISNQFKIIQIKK